MNPRIITQGEEVMSDFQFKAIIALVLKVLDKCETVDEYEIAKKEIAELSNITQTVKAKKTKPAH
jgi:hypothetical protein